MFPCSHQSIPSVLLSYVNLYAFQYPIVVHFSPISFSRFVPLFSLLVFCLLISFAPISFVDIVVMFTLTSYIAFSTLLVNHAIVCFYTYYMYNTSRLLLLSVVETRNPASAFHKSLHGDLVLSIFFTVNKTQIIAGQACLWITLTIHGAKRGDDQVEQKQMLGKDTIRNTKVHKTKNGETDYPYKLWGEHSEQNTKSAEESELNVRSI